MSAGSTDTQYDLIVVGTGPSSSFFLKTYFERFGADRKVLVLERGQRRSHAEMREQGDWTDPPEEPLYIANPPRSANPQSHRWLIRPSFGGNSNYWLGDTPRFVPSDFRTRSLFGVGDDWPIGYDDIEADYTAVENTMAIAGADDIAAVGWRSQPYPLPPHRFSDPDMILKAAYPETFFAFPAARASRPTGNRPACCNSNVCAQCPVDAKFRVGNELEWLYEQPSVELRLDARVRALDIVGGTVRGVIYVADGQEQTARGDLVALGTNPIFNSEIMLRSGDTSPYLGKGISTHPWYMVTCLLDGVDGFQGGTIGTGISFELYTDEIRRAHAGCLLITSNVPFLRPEYGRWRQVLQLQASFEDVPLQTNFVDIDPASDIARVNYETHSDYTERGRAALDGNLARVLGVLPIEDILISDLKDNGAHIMCTHRMGDDPETSVIDADLKHHRYRNVVLLGGGAFVTPAAANPTLTMCALSLRAARHL